MWNQHPTLKIVKVYQNIKNKGIFTKTERKAHELQSWDISEKYIGNF